MNKKLILYIAMSLDGNIADPNGGVDWLKGDGSKPGVTMDEMGFSDFLKSIDNIIMGHSAYDVTKSFGNLGKQFPNKNIYVMTSQDINDDDIIVTRKKPKQIMEEISGKTWLFGGGKLASSFLQEDLVTHLELSIIPTMIGDGIPLFREIRNEIKWTFKNQSVYDGIIILKYERRKNESR